jgi:hypothetical protein
MLVLPWCARLSILVFPYIKQNSENIFIKFNFDYMTCIEMSCVCYQDAINTY